MSRPTFPYPVRAVQDDGLLPSAKSLLLVLYAHYDTSGEFPITIQPLQHLSGFSSSTICSALENLIEAEYIIPTYQRRVEYRRCRFYQEHSFLTIQRGIYEKLMATHPTHTDVALFLYFCQCRTLNAMDPSIREISEAVGFHRNSVLRSLKRLEQAGIIEIEHRSENGVAKSNCYHLTKLWK